MSISPFTDFLKCKPFVAVGGPSGSGKTSLVTALVTIASSRVSRPISYTTRQRRINEDDAEYRFISSSEFHRLVEQNALLNNDVFADECYGISRESVNAI